MRLEFPSKLHFRFQFPFCPVKCDYKDDDYDDDNKKEERASQRMTSERQQNKNVLAKKQKLNIADCKKCYAIRAQFNDNEGENISDKKIQTNK